MHDIMFYILSDDDMLEIDSADIFEDQKILLFGLPGAFTPTCTQSMLPAYEQAYDNFIDLGFDEVICTSVNDAYVMKAWFDSLGIEKVKPLPDGNAELAVDLGMDVGKDNIGMGLRSWRYAAILVDGEVVKMFVEPGQRDLCDEDPYEQSKPEKVLEYVENHEWNLPS